MWVWVVFLSLHECEGLVNCLSPRDSWVRPFSCLSRDDPVLWGTIFVARLCNRAGFYHYFNDTPAEKLRETLTHRGRFCNSLETWVCKKELLQKKPIVLFISVCDAILRRDAYRLGGSGFLCLNVGTRGWIFVTMAQSEVTTAEGILAPLGSTAKNLSNNFGVSFLNAHFVHREPIWWGMFGQKDPS